MGIVLAARLPCLAYTFCMRAVSLAAFAILAFASSAQSQQVPCKDGRVRYAKPSAAVAQNTRLSPYVTTPFTSALKERSPQGTRWFVNLGPDYTKPGPWNTTLIIANRADGKPFLTASFLAHGNTFSARWLNEKLIFVQVWWGRIESSDLILDVEKGAFTYDEMANYAQVTFCSE